MFQSPSPVRPSPAAARRPISPDPVRELIALLEAGYDPAAVRGLIHESQGLQALLDCHRPMGLGDDGDAWREADESVHNFLKLREALVGKPLKPQIAALRWAGCQESLGQLHRRSEQRRDQADASYLSNLKKELHQRRCRSAICRHRTEVGFLAAARRTICEPDLFTHQDHPRLIVADEVERARYERLLRQPEIPSESSGDLIQDAWEIAELDHREMTDYLSRLERRDAYMLEAPSADAKPVLLASEIETGQTFREVFLSCGCWSLSSEELLPAVRAASVGLHLVR